MRRAAAAEVPHPPQVQQQRPATSNGHRATVELEILKQLKDENDLIRERLISFCNRKFEISKLYRCYSNLFRISSLFSYCSCT